METGSTNDIRKEVREAVSILAPGSGLLLAPVTNVRADTKQSWRNVEAMIDEWKASSRRARSDPVTTRVG